MKGSEVGWSKVRWRGGGEKEEEERKERKQRRGGVALKKKTLPKMVGDYVLEKYEY